MATDGQPSHVGEAPSLPGRRRAGLLWLIPSLVGCGASMEGIYEADARFEHCMALDARGDVKPSMRRACWAEWVAFYTYGQTRDRVGHAQMRIEQLSDPSDFASSESSDGASDKLSGEPRASDDESRRHALCAGTCEAVREDCSRSCNGGVCDRTCAAGFQQCMLTCG